MSRACICAIVPVPFCKGCCPQHPACLSSFKASVGGCLLLLEHPETVARRGILFRIGQRGPSIIIFLLVSSLRLRLNVGAAELTPHAYNPSAGQEGEGGRCVLAYLLVEGLCIV